MLLRSLCLSFVLLPMMVVCTVFAETTKNGSEFSENQHEITLRIDSCEDRVFVEASGFHVLSEKTDQNQCFYMQGEGFVQHQHHPKLPAVTRLVPIHPTKDFNYTVVRYGTEPFNSDSIDHRHNPVTDYYPEQAASISSPFIIRGNRFLKVTFYPIQLDTNSGEMVKHKRITVDINYADNAGVNPVIYTNNRGKSPHYRKYMSIYGNADAKPDIELDYFQEPPPGHYLIVANEQCIPFAAPFIEWRRKSGWKVELLCPPSHVCHRPVEIKELIQERYDHYLEQNLEPFDHILLIGDYDNYAHVNPDPGWLLTAPNHHNDWYYACLEGDDNYADVAVSRWCAGSEDLVELFTHRTMTYEVNPPLHDPEWITRAATYAQRWGGDYHISIATNVRWGRAVLDRIGFESIRTYENTDIRDEDAHRIGPFIIEQYNDGVNILMGRANHFQFRDSFRGVRTTGIFPIDLGLGGHQEWAAWNALRSSNIQNPKGPVAMTAGWGDPPTLPMNAVWLEIVNGFLQHDQTFGWARLTALNSPQGYLPQYEESFEILKRDVQFYGDPGLQYWRGIPISLEVEHPNMITSEASLEVCVIDSRTNRPVEDARVTVYLPGDMPEYDNAEYIDYNDMRCLSICTDNDGIACIYLNNLENRRDAMAYLTVTGRNLLPYQAEIPIQIRNRDDIEIEYSFTEIEGNGDTSLNPGEIHELTISVRNPDFVNSILDLQATCSHNEEYLNFPIDEPIQFGIIHPGETVINPEPLILRIPEHSIDSNFLRAEQAILLFDWRWGNFYLQSPLPLDIIAPAFQVHSVSNDGIIPLEGGTIDVELYNSGRTETGYFSAELRSMSPQIDVTINRCPYPNIKSGETGRNRQNRFSLSVNQSTVSGTNHPMQMLIFNENNAIDSLEFSVMVSGEQPSAPCGPDEYGYYCYDDEDDWLQAPHYDWIEISEDADYDYRGQELELDLRLQDPTGISAEYDLPFEVIFYGERFNRCTISTNGYISFGEKNWGTNFQNFPLDRGIAGIGMIAPMWDNLILTEQSGIYTYHDVDQGIFIIEWYRLRHRYQNSRLTFQVVFYNPDIYANDRGDTDILFQYYQVSDNGDHNNQRGAMPYASIGISSPDGTTGINYRFNNLPGAGASDIQNRRVLLFSTAVDYPQGTFWGRVTDSENHTPVAGAKITCSNGGSCYSSNDGTWRIDNAAVGEGITLSCYKPGFNLASLEDQTLEEGQIRFLHFELSRPEFQIGAFSRIFEINAGEDCEYDLLLQNTGNGELNWECGLDIASGIDYDEWEVRQILNCGEVVDENVCRGVAFANGYYFLARSNNLHPVITVLDEQLNIVNEFPQQNQDDSHGYHDLSYEDEFLWGCSGNSLYKHTLNGTFIDDLRFGNINIEYFAISDEYDDIWLVDDNGDVYESDSIGNIDRRYETGIDHCCGLEYWDSNEEDYPLYIFSQEINSDHIDINRFNPADQNMLHEQTIAIRDDQRLSGIQFCNTIDLTNWVSIALLKTAGNDQIEIRQVANIDDWISISPDQGSIQPNEQDRLQLSIDSENLVEGDYEVNLEFFHNADGFHRVFPLEIEIIDPLKQLEIPLQVGWNLVSFNVLPEITEVPHVFRQLVYSQKLLMVKDGNGRFYSPGDDFNNINEWVTQTGYLVLVNRNAQLQVSGERISHDRALHLEDGWNTCAYYPEVPVDARIALSGIREQLIIAKDGAGRFFLPEYNFNDITHLREGFGYKYKVGGEIDLVYQTNGVESYFPERREMPLQHFPQEYRTEPNMSVFLIGDKRTAGSEIGVYLSTDSTGEPTLAGAGKVDENGYCGITVYGNNTDNITITSQMKFYIANSSTFQPLSVNCLKGKPVYKEDEIFVGQLNNLENPIETQIVDVFPNPANSTLQLRYSLAQPGNTTISIVDLNGRTVKTIGSAYNFAGEHLISVDVIDIPSSIYFLNINHKQNNWKKKIVIVK